MTLLATLTAAESFVSGFEDDELQTGIAELLTSIRNEIGAIHPATPEELDAARALYADDDCQIDEGARTSRAENGYWVAAWVWVAVEDEDDDDACENCGNTDNDGSDICPDCGGAIGCP